MGQAKLKEAQKQAAYNEHMRRVPMPAQIRALPVSPNGWAVPWFAAWMDAAGKEVPIGQGTPDLRVIGRDRIIRAMREGRCWTCGGRIENPPVAAVIGPMCAINRVSSEPPSHVLCARYAVQACPFLTRPRMRRNERDLPEGVVEAPGIALDRNPGVALIWQTAQVTYDRASRLFSVGEPIAVEWWAEGRPATRVEALASIENGLPFLFNACAQETTEAEQTAAREALMRQLRTALRLVPAV